MLAGEIVDKIQNDLLKTIAGKKKEDFIQIQLNIQIIQSNKDKKVIKKLKLKILKSIYKIKNEAEIANEKNIAYSKLIIISCK